MTQRPIYVYVNYACKMVSSSHISMTDEASTIGQDMTEDTMSIRQMCDTFDVTPRTLRFYETKELLYPIRMGQRRLFTKRDRARLKLILRGKRFGFSLEELRQLLDLYDMEGGVETQLSRSYELAKTHLADMEAQKAELEDAIKELKDQMSWASERLREMAKQKTAAA